ncbi:inositol-tetrakisphosphate 1-kinase-like isoform X1 [Sparus aurata]|uniref:inositol-tetrakisphosphate 1-kinase-like isoform X1 n=1 Tax=Sparus aurata TaxID=8175 RepID=UPI0011C0FE50|nr:inositol-tetrakisphosphate 1-kinase-like isoform X1 [Sparus aurata]
MNGHSGSDVPLSVCECCHLAAGGPHTHSPMSGRRVGFCLSDKKRRKIGLDVFAEICAGHGVEVVEIDLSKPLGPQGPFDVIVHKLSDVIVEAEHDSQSQQLLANFQSYVSANPSTVILDPLPAMSQLLDRFVSYRIMTKLHNSLQDWHICSPPYLEIHSASDLPSLQQALTTQGLSFPLICKTRVAHGARSHEVSGLLQNVTSSQDYFCSCTAVHSLPAVCAMSAQMSVIFSAGSLAVVQPPCVLQSFVNHGAVLHKVFVVGDRHFCVERPSLKNFPSGPSDRKTIFFNSHQVSKPESSSDLTALDEQMPCLPPPSSEAVAALVRELRVLLGMTLFGVDIIINIHTHTLTVIDINIFPGYEGVPQFFPSLLSHIESVLDKQASAGPQPTAQTTGGPSAASTGLSDASGTAQGLPSSAS